MVNAGHLRVAMERDGAVCVLKVSGELDFLTAAEFAQHARLVAEAGLSGLCSICRTWPSPTAAGPGRWRRRSARCPVIVRSVRPMVRRLLDLLGLNLEHRDIPEPGADRVHGAGRRRSKTGLAVVQPAHAALRLSGLRAPVAGGGLLAGCRSGGQRGAG